MRMTAALVPSRPRFRQTALDALNDALAATEPLPAAEMQAVTAWLLAVSRSDHTRTAYARDLGQFAAFIRQLGGATLATATPAHVDAWWQWMTGQGRAPKTIGRKLAAVSSFYEFNTEPGGALEDIGRNPARPTRARRTPKGAGRRTPALSAAQLQTVIAAATDPPARALVLLLATTGARISEALGADRGDWAEREGRHTLAVIGKGGKRRELALAGPVVQALVTTGAAGRPPEAPLFIDWAGRRLTYDQAAWSLRRLGQAAELTRTLRPHQLRATYATRARLDHDADVHDIATQLGHASDEMTQIYIREARAAAIGADLNERLAAAILDVDPLRKG